MEISENNHPNLNETPPRRLSGQGQTFDLRRKSNELRQVAEQEPIKQESEEKEIVP